LEAVVHIERMIENGDPDARSVPNVVQKLGPVLNAEVRHPASGLDGEYIEMRLARGDLVTDDRSETGIHVLAAGRFGVIRQDIVIGGDGQLDMFSGQGDDAFVESGIAVAAVGEGVGMRIATDPARGVHFAAQEKIQGECLALRDVEGSPVDPVFKASRSMERVMSRAEMEAGPAVGGIDHTRPHRQRLAGIGSNRNEGALVVRQGQTAGQRPAGIRLADPDHQDTPGEGLGKRSGIEKDLPQENVIPVVGRKNGQLILAIAQ